MQSRQFIISLVVSCLTASAAYADCFTGKVIGIADGDTITVMHDAQPEKIRLANIDCPEKRQAFGAAAKRYTSELAHGQEVTVTTEGHDRYKRTIGDVHLPDGRDLNQELVRAGLAWCYRKYCHDPNIAMLESEARQGSIGLWMDTNPLAPWEFRHGATNEKSTNRMR